MLKKFRSFFRSPASIDISFTPFVVRLNHRSLQVMQASDANIPDLLFLEREVYSGRTPWSRFSFKNEIRKKSSCLYLVVYDASVLVAFVGMRFNLTEAHITNIAVKSEYQNQGIANYLLKLLINKAKQNEICQVTLEVRSDNYVAQHVYRKLGFKDNFIRKNYYTDTHTDAISMILRLQAQSFN